MLPSRLGSDGILRLLPGINDDPKTWTFHLAVITNASRFFIAPDVSLHAVSNGDLIYAVLMAEVPYQDRQHGYLFIAVLDCNKDYFQMWGRLNGKFAPLGAVVTNTAWQPGSTIDALMKYGCGRTET